VDPLQLREQRGEATLFRELATLRTDAPVPQREPDELRWRGAGIAEVAVLLDGRADKITDRDAAAKLTRTELFIDRDRLPPAEEDEFYLSDLVGLAAFDASGRELGKVALVHDYGAGASLEIEGAGRPIIVPFTRACVPVVDIAAGRVEIVPPDEVDVPNADAEHAA